MSSLKCLSNESLIEAYKSAIELNLQTEFVMLLVCEIKQRGIEKVEI